MRQGLEENWITSHTSLNHWGPTSGSTAFLWALSSLTTEELFFLLFQSPYSLLCRQRHYELQLPHIQLLFAPCSLLKNLRIPHQHMTFDLQQTFFSSPKMKASKLSQQFHPQGPTSCHYMFPLSTFKEALKFCKTWQLNRRVYYNQVTEKSEATHLETHCFSNSWISPESATSVWGS